MSTITITFGEQAENQRGMQVIGKAIPKGFQIQELLLAQKTFQQKGFDTQILDLNIYLQEQSQEAAVLVIRNGVHCLLKDTNFSTSDLLKEMTELQWDKKGFMYGKVVNKHARYNICFGEHPQEPQYEKGKGRIIPWKEAPILSSIRDKLKEILPNTKEELVAEGNYYYDSKKCGVGFHGDEERKKVIGFRLSTGDCPPLHYQWFKKRQPIGQRAVLALNHGDLYIMSEKATGNDEKKTQIPTLKHATGAQKFTTI